MLRKISLFGVSITNETEEVILEYILNKVEKTHKKLFIVTPNPEIIMYAKSHKAYQDLLNEADVALPDGIGVFVGAGLLGHRLKERIPGVDFMEELCRRCEKKPVSMGFLGGRGGVAKKAAECLMKKYPWIKVRWIGEEWDNSIESKVKNQELRKQKKEIESIDDSGWKNPYISGTDPIDILFVAYGFPKQEEWIYENLKHLPVKAAMGVGGAFDFISGNVPRAPFMIRAMGFEWLYRLVIQPWRIKRQLVLIQFVCLLLQQLGKKYLFRG